MNIDSKHGAQPLAELGARTPRIGSNVIDVLVFTGELA
jgi:hypothetical protein